MDEIKDEKALPVESAPIASLKSNSESQPVPLTDEPSKVDHLGMTPKDSEIAVGQDSILQPVAKKETMVSPESLDDVQPTVIEFATSSFSASPMPIDMHPTVCSSAESPTAAENLQLPDDTPSQEMQVLLSKSENGTSVRVTGIQENDSDETKPSEEKPHSLIIDEHLSESRVPKAPNPPPSVALVKPVKLNRGLVDTAAPFESVKEAVSMFGGIVDWKAHRTQTLERRKQVQIELQKFQEEIPHYKKQTEAAEVTKTQLLSELDSTKRLIEELKLSLEKGQIEEAQAKQDSELALLRVKEMEEGIAGDASVAAKAQLDVAKARYAAAVSELRSVQNELKSIQDAYVQLVKERDMAVKRAEEAVSASKDVEKTVEDLTLELISAREALESAHAAHMEAEEHRIGAALARDQDSLNWENELKQAEEELQQLNEKLSSVKDLQLKLDTASTLLLNLKAELAAYMEAKLNEESQNIVDDSKKDEIDQAKSTHAVMQATFESMQKEIEEAKNNIEKAKEEVKFLKVAASSLKSELETEKAALSTMKQREGMASIAVSSLEAELSRTKMEIKQVQGKEKEIREQMVELPKALQQAAQEAEKAKAEAQSGSEDLKKAKEEAEQAKASLSTLETRLHAALKEIEATNASERLALAAVKALQESEQAASLSLDDIPTGVTLPLEEYYALSKRAHDAEEQANERVATAMAQIDVAKDSEYKCLRNLEAAENELEQRKEALRLAAEKAENAKEGKLGAEQELRKWRADHERSRKATEASQVAVNPSASPRRSMEENKEPGSFIMEQQAANVSYSSTPSKKLYAQGHNIDEAAPEMKIKKKKSLFPRLVMFLARKKRTQQ